jgi:Ca2+-binding RTX toxin-like protein
MSLAALEAAKFAKILAGHHLSPTELGAGADYFIATNSTETFNGGSGRDTVSYHQSTTGVNVNFFDTGAETGGFARGDTLQFIENVIGSNYADSLFGNSGANTIVGLGGNDTIYGGGGADRLYGDSGSDLLSNFGTRGVTSFMDGGSDVDTLKFGTNGGRAEITTGTGRDLVEISITNSQDFRVVITDFQPYWEANGSTVTDAEALQGDRLKLHFNSLLGTDINTVTQYQQEINGDDLILHFNSATVHGDVVFQGIGNWLDLDTNNGFTFAMDADFYQIPQAV